MLWFAWPSSQLAIFGFLIRNFLCSRLCARHRSLLGHTFLAAASMMIFESGSSSRWKLWPTLWLQLSFLLLLLFSRPLHKKRVLTVGKGVIQLIRSALFQIGTLLMSQIIWLFPFSATRYLVLGSTLINRLRRWLLLISSKILTYFLRLLAAVSWRHLQGRR
jgi:hypothetical protein